MMLQRPPLTPAELAEQQRRIKTQIQSTMIRAVFPGLDREFQEVVEKRKLRSDKKRRVTTSPVEIEGEDPNASLLANAPIGPWCRAWQFNPGEYVVDFTEERAKKGYVNLSLRGDHPEY